MNDEFVEYIYRFDFDDGRTYTFNLNLSSDRLRIIKDSNSSKRNKPDWTRLDFHKCPNCTLSRDEHDFCPVAEGLTEIVDAFKQVLSYEVVNVTVFTPEREIKKRLPTQLALGSFIGVYDALTGCPILGKLAPMAKFHLPFATVEETSYRMVSNYLLAQYFVKQEGGEPDWDLEELKKFYKEVEKVNSSLCERIRSASQKDANVNAVIFLDSFAKNIAYLSDKAIDRLKPVFKEYIKELKE